MSAAPLARLQYGTSWTWSGVLGLALRTTMSCPAAGSRFSSRTSRHRLCAPVPRRSRSKRPYRRPKRRGWVDDRSLILLSNSPSSPCSSLRTSAQSGPANLIGPLMARSCTVREASGIVGLRRWASFKRVTMASSGRAIQVCFDSDSVLQVSLKVEVGCERWPTDARDD